MKKRLLCFLLSAVMLLACLAGCSQKTDDDAKSEIDDKASESAMTLCMYLMSENKISPEQEQLIETEVNRITKAKFKTQLDLKFFTEDEYYAQLEKAFADRKAAEDAGEVTAPVEGDETKEDETVMSEIGVQIKYPTIASHQVDIFYVGGYEKFTQYKNDGKMQALDTELESASKKIKEYVAPALIDYLDKVEGSVYGIPSNGAIGNYTYILLNNELLEAADYNTTTGKKMFDSITDPDLARYLELAKNEHGYNTPIYSELTNTELASLGMNYGVKYSDKKEYNEGIKYFGVNSFGQFSNDFSLIGDVYNKSASLGQKDLSCMYNIGKITDNTLFEKSLSTVMSYKADNYFGTAKDFEDGKVAVAFLEGGAQIPDQYADKYTAVAIKNPTIDTMDVYGDMLAVSSYTTNTARSMEIITYLNTNEEFRNILLYGVENVNYELVDSDIIDETTGLPYKAVKRLNENYMMDPAKVGNTLIGHFLDGDVNDNPVIRKYIQAQNRAVSASITMGFKYTEEVAAEDLAKLRDLSAKVEDMINKYEIEDADDWRNKYSETKLVNDINTLLSEKDNAALLTKLANAEAPAEGSTGGIAYIYKLWAESTKIYVEKVVEEGAE